MSSIVPILTREFFLSPASGFPYWKITDSTDYTTYGISNSDVKGNFKLTSPLGIIHNGVSWASPDIDRSTIVNSYQQTPPLDNNSVPQEGTYSDIYTIQITRAISAFAQTPNYFEISGDLTSITPTSGQIVISGSTLNDGTYTIVSVSLVGGNTRFVVLEPIPSLLSTNGSLSFYNTFSSVQYDFFWCAPTPNISVSYDCVAPRIQSTDNTIYAISRLNVYTSLSPTSLSRVNTLEYPSGITPVQPANSVVSGQTNTVNELYTGTWTALIQTNLIYALPNGGLLVNYTLTGVQESDVECSNGLCEISQCVYNAMNAFNNAVLGDYRDFQRKEQTLLQIVAQWIKYSTALQCGNTEEQTQALNAIVSITASADCGCFSSSQNSSAPIKIIGYGGANGGASTTVVASSGVGLSVTPSVVGSTTTYTVALNFSAIAAELVTTYNIIDEAALDAWWISTQNAFGIDKVLTTNGAGLIIGTTKGTAFNKNFGINAGDVPEIASTLGVSQAVFTDGSGKLITAASTNNYRLLHNNNTDVSNSTDSPVNLMSYTLPLNTISTNDSLLVVTAEVNFTTTSTIDPDCNIDLYFGTYQFNVVQTYLAGQIIVVLEISRLAVNSQRIRAIVYQNGSPVATYTPALTTTNQDFANNIVIRIEGNKTPALGFTTTVTAKTLRVEAKIK